MKLNLDKELVDVPPKAQSRLWRRSDVASSVGVEVAVQWRRDPVVAAKAVVLPVAHSAPSQLD